MDYSIFFSTGIAVFAIFLGLDRQGVVNLRQAPVKDYEPVTPFQEALSAISSAPPPLPPAVDVTTSPWMKKFLFVNDGNFIPDLNVQGSDNRVLSLLARLRELGQTVVFHDSHCDLIANLKPRQVQLFHKEMKIEMVCTDAQNISSWLQQENFDAAILPLWPNMERYSWYEKYTTILRNKSPSTRLVVLSDFVHHERERAFAELEKNNETLARIPYYHRQEMEAHHTADMVLSITKPDTAEIMQRSLLPPERVLLLRHSEPLTMNPAPFPSKRTAVGKAFKDRSGLVFVGGNHAANRHAIRYFLEHCWPQLSTRIPDITVTIVGSLKVNADDPRIINAGHVEDIDATMRSARILIGAKMAGGGLSTKNMLGLTNGLPIVANTLGAAGFDGLHNHAGLVADDMQLFTEYVYRVYTDAELWSRLSESGLMYLGAKASAAHTREDVSELIARLQQLGPRPGLPDTYKSIIVDDSTHVRLAKAYVKEEKWLEAIVQFDKALKLKRDHPPTYLELGNCLFNLGKARKSIPRLQQAVAVYQAGIETGEESLKKSPSWASTVANLNKQNRNNMGASQKLIAIFERQQKQQEQAETPS